MQPRSGSCLLLDNKPEIRYLSLEYTQEEEDCLCYIIDACKQLIATSVIVLKMASLISGSPSLVGLFLEGCSIHFSEGELDDSGPSQR